MHRVKCARCGCLWWPHLPFVKGNARYTRSFTLTVLDLLQFSTIRAVAGYLRVSWDLVKEIHKRCNVQGFSFYVTLPGASNGLIAKSADCGHEPADERVVFVSGRIFKAGVGIHTVWVDPC